MSRSGKCILFSNNENLSLHFLFHLFKNAHCERNYMYIQAYFKNIKEHVIKGNIYFPPLWPVTYGQLAVLTTCSYILNELCAVIILSVWLVFFFFPPPVSQCSFGFWLVFLIAPFNCPFNYLNSLDFVSSLRLETFTGIVRYYLNLFLKFTKRDSMYQSQLPHLLSFLLVLKYL